MILEDQNPFAVKARTDAGFAIAYAIMEMVDEMHRLATAVSELHEPLRSDHPLQGETFTEIVGALEGIASSINTADNSGDIASALEDIADAIKKESSDD